MAAFEIVLPTTRKCTVALLDAAEQLPAELAGSHDPRERLEGMQ